MAIRPGSSSKENQIIVTLPIDYADRVYSGWLGKCIGVRFGAPTESLTYRDIQSLFGELNAYLQTDPRLFHPDDDLTGPILFLRALDDYGDDPPADRFGDVWLNNIADGRGTLWWGGYGISTEHTAYMNLAAGVRAPHSGSIATNGATIAEQIGGQIFSDGWGLICPNNPARAAELARRAAAVSHDGEGVYGGMYVAATVAAAFGARTARETMDAGLAVIPAESMYARVVREVMAFHDAHPAHWRDCYAWIFAYHGYDKYPGRVHIIPNAAIMAMAMLYGHDDFVETIKIANMGGWDTDCNAGNVGSVLGVLGGLAGIPAEWRRPMNDFFTLASLTGSRNMMDIGHAADLFVRHGHRQARLAEPTAKARYHFDYPGSTQGFTPEADTAGIVTIAQTSETGNGCLKITGRDMFRRRSMGASARTYLRPADLDGNNYRGSFSPAIYPGQTIRARVMAHPDANPELVARLFVRDANSGERIEQGPGQTMVPGQWQDLEWRIPPRTGACLDQVGIWITAMHNPHLNESVYLDDLDWSGPPDFGYDFMRERTETDASSQWTFVRGYWSLSGDAYVGSGVGQNETYSGDLDWADYTVSVVATPVNGDAHCLLARTQGALRSYALALLPGRLALLRNDSGYAEVASAPFDWRPGQRYSLTLRAEGAALTGSAAPAGDAADGARVAWTDPKPYRSGMIGLANQRGCRTEFRKVTVKP